MDIAWREDMRRTDFRKLAKSMFASALKHGVSTNMCGHWQRNGKATKALVGCNPLSRLQRVDYPHYRVLSRPCHSAGQQHKAAMTTLIFLTPGRLELSDVLTFVSEKWYSEPVGSYPLHGSPSFRVTDYGFQGEFTFDEGNLEGSLLVGHVNELAAKFRLPAINFFDVGLMTVYYAEEGSWQYQSTQLALPLRRDGSRAVRLIRFKAAGRMKIP